MPKLAQSIAPILPSVCAAGEIAQDEGLATAMPDGNKALFVNAKAKKQPIQAYLAKSQPFIVEAAPLALARPARLKIEKWGVQGTQESGWTTLQADPAKTGMHTQGRWQADVEIATNLARVLLAQVLPTRVEVGAKESAFEPKRSVVFETMWIDILLHQIENANTKLCALSMLELAAYCIDNNEVKLLKSVKSSPMPMEMLSVFTLGYRLKNARITIDICSELDRQMTTTIDIEKFGETLPIVKLRSGRALPNGIFRAKYRQIVSWSA